MNGLAWLTQFLEVLAALALAPLPKSKVLGVVNFPTFRAAMAAAQHIVALGPTAVELVDRTMIELARANPAFRPVIERALIGQPEAILLVEFGEDDQDENLRLLVAQLDKRPRRRFQACACARPQAEVEL